MRSMRKTQKIIVGVDEAGRGPLAGPVVAAAVYAPQCFVIGLQNIEIRDSKKMTARQRERTYEFLKDQPDVEWGIGRAGERVIDRINILEATKLAMKRAVKNLEKKIGKKAALLLIDGKIKLNLKTKQEAIIRGDQKVVLISMASIIAKVSRDRAMARYHRKYPGYNFSQHKGYPTKEHYQTILTHGPSKLHRQSFRLA